MKRCPQCEFIYEYDQSLCDMDGVLLVFDSRKLPNVHALATVPAIPKNSRRNRAVPAFATLVLALVLGMVYYVSTRQPSYTPPTQPSALSIAPVTIPTPEPQPSPEPAPVKAEIEESTAPVKKPATKIATVTQPKRTSEPKKEDSKVNSILKKTGRILKKPFKKF
ncbi:MAG TPA: hypothetical protein VJ656_08885 [Pyrinomonadaceae bacterium]|nr:hypothetical protein [Pyrinomonadaceae bacterium]